MCTPSVPKAPPAQPEKNKPRYMLSRDQFDELRGGFTAMDPLMIQRGAERSTSSNGFNPRGGSLGLGLSQPGLGRFDLRPGQGVSP